MYSIGECSRITGLSVKALRLYHEKGLLVPHTVDKSTGYRNYSHEDIEKARLIRQLRNMELSINDIQTILEYGDDNEFSLETIIRHQESLKERIKEYTSVVKTLNQYVKQEQEALKIMQEASFEVEQKEVDIQLIAAKKYVGKYSECGPVFGEICRKAGWLMSGKPFCLYVCEEYQEDDAEIECCVPIKKQKELDGLDVREISGGKCLSLLHKGPYEEISRSYEKIIGYAKEKGIDWKLPIREIYIKGPGMIFRGNPKKYITEIQLMINK